MGSGRRRLWLLIAAVVVIATGLAVHFLAEGPASALVGDALYAVMAYLIVAIVVPRADPLVVALIAFAGCAAVEFFQLTPVPRALAEAFPPSSLVLGTGFAVTDLVAYAVGVAVGALADLVARSAGIRFARSGGRSGDRGVGPSAAHRAEPGE
jgi:hypothetical protein